ncbi:hypothetical protein MNB_SV-10-195 [hydrothermal vent metagenome]|uniref:Uncharacterized protein n=1 Tax=hydrothermal vent metagenome TaxID=652676 RepID=A0A1W1C8D7_9ZZZZ
MKFDDLRISFVFASSYKCISNPILNIFIFNSFVLQVKDKAFHPYLL